jgi:HlyD family secretion protein
MAPGNNQKEGFFTRRRWLLWTAAVAVAVVLFASFMSRDDAVPIRAAKVQRGNIRSVISTNGKVEPVQNFEAHAPIGTSVKRVLVKEGDHVKRGQLLVQLNDSEARDQAARALSQISAAEADINAVKNGGTQEEVLTVDADLAKARTERDAAQHNLDALQRLQQQGAASPGEVRNAQDQLTRADADVKLLEQKQRDRYSKPEVARVDSQKEAAQASYHAAQDILSQLDVHAPFDGIVFSLPAKQGAYLNPGDLILQEANLSKILVRAFVDEPDVGRLAVGDKVEVTWDGLPGKIWNATINTLPSTMKIRNTRTVGETTCIVDNADFRLLPNVNVGVTIVSADHNGVLTVPREAVRLSDDKPYVYEVSNDELVRREIKTAISDLTSVEVSGGISENALVALNSINSKPLKNGIAVKVVPQ